ncbi:beta-propeller fold lactonase family protein [Thalassospira alkalitolerans]|uniref:beta-propeller fold lactonase family protein n=1 Tax=Thalassospira alkalitolerans TaxID=1293890 RepID=UPI003AA7C421
MAHSLSKSHKLIASAYRRSLDWCEREAEVFEAGDIEGDEQARLRLRDHVAERNRAALLDTHHSDHSVQNFSSHSIPDLDGANGLAISSDGRSIYVTSGQASALLIFDRDPASGSIRLMDVLHHDDAGIDRMREPHGVAVSPDGNSVVVADRWHDALVFFRRDQSSGALDPEYRISDEQGNAVGLQEPFNLCFSPDGNQLLVGVTEFLEANLLVFSRDQTSGRFTFSQSLKSELEKCEGLRIPQSVAFAPDGNGFYVTAYNGTVLGVFERSLTGDIFHLSQLLEDGVDDVRGLEGTEDVAVSSDGLSVLVVGHGRGDLCVFHRDAASGKLVFDRGSEDRLRNGRVTGGAFGVAISAGGDRVFVSGRGGDLIDLWHRDPKNGNLIFGRTLGSPGQGDSSGGGVRNIAVTPDGRSLILVDYQNGLLAVFDLAEGTRRLAELGATLMRFDGEPFKVF